MSEKYTPPVVNSTGFHCPHCQVFAHQSWGAMFHDVYSQYRVVQGYRIGLCARCQDVSVWRNGKLIVPDQSPSPMPSDDMPEDVRKDYEEARSVFSKSPRSSAALLRLAVQKLCIDLGGGGRNLNEDIGALVKKGLPPEVQRALDIVRVVGNNQVHPGVLDVRDDPETAAALFSLINLTVEVMISRPKQVEALFNKLPADAVQQIQRRDTGKP